MKKTQWFIRDDFNVDEFNYLHPEGRKKYLKLRHNCFESKEEAIKVAEIFKNIISILNPSVPMEQ